jgi:hypothetical protein
MPQEFLRSTLAGKRKHLWLVLPYLRLQLTSAEVLVRKNVIGTGYGFRRLIFLRFHPARRETDLGQGPPECIAWASVVGAPASRSSAHRSTAEPDSKTGRKDIRKHAHSDAEHIMLSGVPLVARPLELKLGGDSRAVSVPLHSSGRYL